MLLELFENNLEFLIDSTFKSHSDMQTGIHPNSHSTQVSLSCPSISLFVTSYSKSVP